MSKYLRGTVLAAVTAMLSLPAQAAPTVKFVSAFIEASEHARRPGATTQDIERFLAFMADDLKDHHIAYSRSFDGKEHLRSGIKKKAEAMVSISQDVESVVVGSGVVVVAVNEQSEYYKDEKLKQFQGRTIMVLVFNEEGLISEIQRYLD